MTEIERTVEYQPRNQHIEAASINKVKHTPISGTTYTQKNDFIEFRVNNNGDFINDVKFNCDFTATGTSAGSGTYNLFTSESINSCFSRITITQGGNLLENIVDYNRIYSVYSRVYSSKFQHGSIGSMTDLYQDPYGTHPNHTGTGVQISTATGNPPASYVSRKISVPISLSNLLGPSKRKALPLALLKGGPLFIRFFLTSNVEEVLYCHNSTAGSTATFGADTSYKLSNVNLEIEHIRYPSEAMAMIKAGIGAEVVFDGVQCISSTNSIGYSAQERVIMPNTSYSDVRNVIIAQHYPTLSSNQLNMGVSPLNGTYQAQLLLDGSPVAANRPVGASESNAVMNSIPEFAKSVIQLNRPVNMADDTQTAIGPTQATSAEPIYNFTNNNGGTGTAGQVFNPTDNPVPTVASFGIDANTLGVAPYFGYIGFDLVQNGDPSRAQTGVDMRGRQLVYDARQTNAIAAGTTNCVVMAILSIGVKYVLDVNSGVMRTVY